MHHSLAMMFERARRSSPSVIFIPNLHSWWSDDAEDPRRLHGDLLIELVENVATLPILIVSTSEISISGQHPAILRHFSKIGSCQVLPLNIARSVAIYGVCELHEPSEVHRRGFLNCKFVLTLTREED